MRVLLSVLIMNTEQILKPTAVSLAGGLVIGLLFSLIHFKLVSIHITNTIKRHDKASLLSTLGNMARPMILAIPVAVSMICPQYFNVFAVFVGVMIPKLYLFFRAIRERR